MKKAIVNMQSVWALHLPVDKAAKLMELLAEAEPVGDITSPNGGIAYFKDQDEREPFNMVLVDTVIHETAEEASQSLDSKKSDEKSDEDANWL